jgi:hypothetical protein
MCTSKWYSGSLCRTSAVVRYTSTTLVSTGLTLRALEMVLQLEAQVSGKPDAVAAVAEAPETVEEADCEPFEELMEADRVDAEEELEGFGGEVWMVKSESDEESCAKATVSVQRETAVVQDTNSASLRSARRRGETGMA